MIYTFRLLSLPFHSMISLEHQSRPGQDRPNQTMQKVLSFVCFFNQLEYQSVLSVLFLDPVCALGQLHKELKRIYARKLRIKINVITFPFYIFLFVSLFIKESELLWLVSWVGGHSLLALVLAMVTNSPGMVVFC